MSTSFSFMFSLLSVALLITSVSSVRARDITFPPVAAQAPLHSHPGDVLFEPSPYSGLTTYANIPFEHCFTSDNDTAASASTTPPAQPYDIAILGAPFDTGTTARPGARFGPHGIRDGSRRIFREFGWDAYTGENVFADWARIVDCGDAPLTFLDNTVALQQLEKAHWLTTARKAANVTVGGEVPRIITLGGDHTTTLAALRVAAPRWGAVSALHFDSHLDTWDPEVLGGDVSHYAGVNHGTFLHLAHEEGLILNGSSLHVGIRAPMRSRKGDLKNDRRCGFDIVEARAIDRIGVDGIVAKIKARLGDTRVYISVDIDVLDPAFAPATGTAEVGGWSTRELLSILDGLDGVNVVGADVVEVAPIYDNRGETTTLAAAAVVHSLLTLMVDTPVKR